MSNSPGIEFEGRVKAGEYWWGLTKKVFVLNPHAKGAEREIPGSPHVFEPTELEGEDSVYDSLSARAQMLGDVTNPEHGALEEFASIGSDPTHAVQFAGRYGLLGIGAHADREPVEEWFYESAAMAVVLRALHSLALEPRGESTPFYAPIGDYEHQVWDYEFPYLDEHSPDHPRTMSPFSLASAKRPQWEQERWGVLYTLTKNRIEENCGLSLSARNLGDWPIAPDGSSPLRVRLKARNLLGALWYEVARIIEGGELKVCDLCDSWWLKTDRPPQAKYCEHHKTRAGNLRVSVENRIAKGWDRRRIAGELGIPIRGVKSLLDDNKNPGPKKKRK